jgi:WD40 repeat protein
MYSDTDAQSGYLVNYCRTRNVSVMTCKYMVLRCTGTSLIYTKSAITRGSYINRRPAVSAPFIGHTDSVFSVAFAPNGHYVASGSQDKTICIWNAARGTQSTRPLIGHRDTVFAVAYSPDGRFIVSGSADNEIRVWDAKRGTIRIWCAKGGFSLSEM